MLLRTPPRLLDCFHSLDTVENAFGDLPLKANFGDHVD